MAQLLVRNLETQLKNRLQSRARRNRRSMEQEAREILRNALREEDAPAIGLGSQISSLFADAGMPDEIREFRGYSIVPPSFEQ